MTANQVSHSRSNPPIVLIHGLWMTALCRSRKSERIATTTRSGERFLAEAQVEVRTEKRLWVSRTTDRAVSCVVGPPIRNSLHDTLPREAYLLSGCRRSPPAAFLSNL